MTAGLPRCDECTSRGFGTRQANWESALYIPAERAWLCELCRVERGVPASQPVVPGVHQPGYPGYMKPGSPEHSVMISPSKVASILGISRWESAYTLWHRMKALIPPEPPKDAFDVGHDLEPYAANRWRRKNPGWRLSVGEVQWVLDPHQFGFPVIATVDRRATRGRAQRVVELKRALTMSDLEQWGDDLTGDLPEDYAAQVTAQMLFSGLEQRPGHVVAIGPYYQDRVYDVDYDPDVADWIESECREFWNSLRRDEPPALDKSLSTYNTVRALHPDIDGTTVQVDADLAIAVHNAAANAKDADKELRGLKTQLLDAMGNAQHAEFNGLKVADRRPHAKGGVSLNLARTHPAQQTQKGSAA